MMRSMLQLFQSGVITSLEGVGFVIRAADVRLTAEQRYIFESVLQMFGRDMAGSFLSLLTFHDSGDPMVVAALRQANIQFAKEITFNSHGIFQHKENVPVDDNLINKYPEAARYQYFFDSAKQVFDLIQSAKSKDLKLTIEVLKEREEVGEDLNVLSIFQDKLRSLREDVEEEQKKVEQFRKEAEANEKGETEVSKEEKVKVAVETGKYVSNCLQCSQTCCYPCSINKAKMRGSNSFRMI